MFFGGILQDNTQNHESHETSDADTCGSLSTKNTTWEETTN